MTGLVDKNGKPLFPGGLPKAKAKVVREWYFTDKENKECYMVLVERLSDGEMFTAGCYLNPEDPIISFDTWETICKALAYNHNLEVKL